MNRMLLAALAALATVLAATPSFAQSPGLIPVQGYLVDSNGDALDGDFDITASVYDAATAGAQLHTETQSITVDEGFFTIYLGASGNGDFDLSLFADHGELWLALAVGTDPDLDPRIRMGTAGYSGHAKTADDADNLGGLPAADYALFSDTISDMTCPNAGEQLAWDTTNGWVCTAAGGETDPVFTGSPVGSTTQTDLDNWNAAYGWGNHANASYLSSESDPNFNASAVASVTSTQVANWDTAFGYGNHATAGYISTETDPVYGASVASGITQTMVDSWTTQAGYGDHAGAGYLTTEVDGSITNETITDFSLSGNTLSLTEAGTTTTVDLGAFDGSFVDVENSNATVELTGSDSTYPDTGVALRTQTNPPNSGDAIFRVMSAGGSERLRVEHDGALATTNSLDVQGTATSTFAGGVTVTGTVAATSFSGSGANLSGVVTSESDPVYSSAPAAGISSTQISNWDTQATYGNHASQGYLNNTSGDARYVNNTGDTITGDLTFSSGLPRIILNDTTDVGFEWAIKADGEDYVISEPEASGQVHFRIIDEGDIQLRPDGTTALAASPNGNVAVTGALSAASYTGDGSGLSGVLTPSAGDAAYLNDTGADGWTGTMTALSSAGIEFETSSTAAAGGGDFGIRNVGDDLEIWEPETGDRFMYFDDAGPIEFHPGGTANTTAPDITFETDGTIITTGAVESQCPTGTTAFGGWCIEDGNGTDANGGSGSDTWNDAWTDCDAKGMQICPVVAYAMCDDTGGFTGANATLACEYETDVSTGVDGLYTSDFAGNGGSVFANHLIYYAAGNALVASNGTTAAEWLCCTPVYNP